MAINVSGSRFRKVDVDQFTGHAFHDDQSDDSGVKFNEGEVNQLLASGKPSEGLKYILQNAPVGSKDQVAKDAAFNLAMRALQQGKQATAIDDFIKQLDEKQLDILMQYIYRGFDESREANQSLLLQWHEKLYNKGQAGSILRVLTDRRRV